MKIRVLGASGSEVPGHNLPAFLIDGSILMDAGTIGISLKPREQLKIKHILLTHAHLDHIRGIPFLLDNMIVAGYARKPVTLMSGRDVLIDIKENLLNNRIWPNFTELPDKKRPLLKFVAMNASRPATINGYLIYCEKMNHTVPAYGYIVKDRVGSAVAYTGDTGPTDLFWKKVSGCPVKGLIVEVSFPDRMTSLAIKSGHLTPALLKREMTKMRTVPGRVFITHAKPHYIRDIRKEVRALGMANIEILRDGQVITL